VETPWPRLAEAPRASHAVAVQTDDPIAELIGMSSRIMAVQRVLSNYGYGQLKPTGILDRPTSAAIERFEREHRLPVTGRISGRLVSELAQMAGHPID
jgi:peptidoglycan hydrolase-like protein with peptidoglycan-binding domain